ncbi:MAG: aldehyde ferredoxin oxidoreductase N-terminal domain-containing protein [Sphaerochaetaceae bacterium]
MKHIGGGREYLLIDLASESWQRNSFGEEELLLYAGGEALGLALFQSLGDDEALLLVCGALTGSTLVGSDSLSIIGRSPASGLIEAQSMHTPFAQALSALGVRALVLRHALRRPMSLHLYNDRLEFRPCEKLVGKGAVSTHHLLLQEGALATLTIGPAAENGALSASIIGDGKRTERSGFGALFGQKQIKAIVVSESGQPCIPAQKEAFEQLQQALGKALARSPFIQGQKYQGTLVLIPTLQKYGAAAVDAVTKRTDPRLFHLGPKEWARKHLLVTDFCSGCEYGCTYKVMQSNQESIPLPSALSVLALGSNIGNYDQDLVLLWHQKALELGLDPVSSGMIISSELAKEGNLSKPIQPKHIEELLEAIAVTKLVLSTKDDHYSVAVGGKPMAPYDPRGAWGQALSVGLGEDFPFAAELLLNWVKPASIVSKAELAVLQENLLGIMRSVGLCPFLMVPLLLEGAFPSLIRPLKKMLAHYPLFVNNLANVNLIARLLSTFDTVAFSETDVMNIGRRSAYLKRSLNEGKPAFPAPIPQRFLTDPESNFAEMKTVPYRGLVDAYQFLRMLDIGELENDASL